MAKTYEIPTATGLQTVEAGSKSEALGMVPNNTATKPVVPTSITTASLAPATAYQMPTAPTTPTTANLAMSTTGVTSGIAADANYTPPTQAKDSLAEMLKSIGGDVAGQSAAIDQVRNEAQIYEKKQKATAVSNQLDQMDKAYRDEINQIKANAQGTFGGGVQAEINDATDRYNNNRANVALTYKVLAGDYNDAQQIVQDKITSLKDQNAQKIQLYQLAAQAVQNDLTESEKLQVQANLTRKQKEADVTQAAYETALERAVQNEAPASVLSAIDAASRAPGATAATIMEAAGKYGVDQAAQLDIQVKRAQLAKALKNESEAPTVKTINGVDMQWNPQTNQWESIGSSAKVDTNTASQLKFLRETATKAKELSSAAGASGISKFIGDKLVGDTKFRRLEAQTNTLRTNVLTLMTDPGVKKYFGPQMSEADVRLMTAAGTTLNPENQSPADLKEEIERLDGLFARMQEAVTSGVSNTTASGAVFDVAAAKAAGYSEDEIKAYLSTH